MSSWSRGNVPTVFLMSVHAHACTLLAHTDTYGKLTAWTEHQYGESVQRVDMCVVYAMTPGFIHRCTVPHRMNSENFHVANWALPVFSLIHDDGNYYLRKDRVLATFNLRTMDIRVGAFAAPPEKLQELLNQQADLDEATAQAAQPQHPPKVVRLRRRGGGGGGGGKANAKPEPANPRSLLVGVGEPAEV